MAFSAQLVVSQGGHTDRALQLRPGTLSLGRADDNDVVLPDVAVSRHHARLIVDAHTVTVEDLGSPNGTYLRGRKIQAERVRDGDEVRIDPFTLRFAIVDGRREPRREGGATAGAFEVVSGPAAIGTRFPIPATGGTVGRSEDCDIVLPDAASSRTHARLTVDGGKVRIRDLGSSNGVFVNGQPASIRPLVEGDVVRIGNTDLRFVATIAGAPSLPSMRPATLLTKAASQESISVAPPAPTGQGMGWLVAALIAALGAMLVVGLVFIGAIWWFTRSQPVEPGRAIQFQTAGVTGPAENPRARFDQGVRELRDERWADALASFHAVLLADPGDPDAEKFALAAGTLHLLDVLRAKVDATTRTRRQETAALESRLSRARRGDDSAIEELVAYAADRKVAAVVGEADGVQEAVAPYVAARSEADPIRATVAWSDLATSAPTADLRQEARDRAHSLLREAARRRAAGWKEAHAQGTPAAWRALADADPTDVAARLHAERLSRP